MCYCNCKYENSWGECTLGEAKKTPHDAKCYDPPVWEEEETINEYTKRMQYISDTVMAETHRRSL